MKKLIITSIILIVSLIVCGPGMANAYDVNGLVNDWIGGINLNAAIGNDGAGSLGTVNYFREDNAGNIGWTQVYPGWTYKNYFDAEAMYFDNDDTNAYIAIISGLPQGGSNAEGRSPLFLPGDIGIDADNNGSYEFAIDVSSYNSATGKANLYRSLTATPAWNLSLYSGSPYYYSAADPFTITGNPAAWELLANQVDFVYSGNQNTHYVMETAIPLSEFDWNWGFDTQKELNLHWTMQCGNDFLNLSADVIKPRPELPAVPEPTSLLLLGLGLAGLTGRRLRKQAKA